MSSIEKQCVICGTSCVGQPRIKDTQGHYAHKACAEKAQAKKAQPEEPVLDLAPEDEYEMSAFLDDLPSDSGSDAATSGIRAACPGCGSSLASDAVVCMNCGCNTKTGRGSKTKAPKIKSAKSGSNIAAKAGTLAIAPFLPIIGAVIGGAIGATVWAAISYFTGYEIGYVAIGVGFVTGLGAVIGSGGDGNAWSGLVAVVVALMSIVAGKAIVNQIYIDQLQEFRNEYEAAIEESDPLEFFTVEDALWNIADEIVYERLENDTDIDWPARGMSVDEAFWPEDYPQDIIDETNERWSAMNKEEQDDYRITIAEDAMSQADDVYDALDEIMDTNTSVFDNLNLFDGLWALLALGAAWGVGSGGSED